MNRAVGALRRSLRRHPVCRPGIRSRWLLAWCLLAIRSGTVMALDVETAQARFHADEFIVEFVALLDAPVASVEQVLHDYDSYPVLDARILEARKLEDADDAVILMTKLRACAGIFCRTVRRVEEVTEGPHELLARVDPARSDLLRGETSTRFEAVGDRTRVLYQTRFVPGFWVPAFLGRQLMLSTLREATIDLFANVESRARQQRG